MNVTSESASRQATSTAVRASFPGLWQSALAAMLAAILVGTWKLQPWPRSAADGQDAVPARLADIAASDIAAARGTLDGSPAAQARAEQADRVCGPHLAQVTLWPARAGQHGRVRVISGNYVSPAFVLGDAPVRIALPYPAPYATGHGRLRVLAIGGDVMLALDPPWRVLAQALPPAATRDVRWTPRRDCAEGSGA